MTKLFIVLKDIYKKEKKNILSIIHEQIIYTKYFFVFSNYFILKNCTDRRHQIS